VDTEANLSWGRNQLVRRVATPWLLLCEDDFEFSEQTRLEPLAEVLGHDVEIAGVGGDLLEPRGRACWAHNYHRRDKEVVATPSTDPLRQTPSGIVYQPCQLIFNFGLFRCELFLQVPWDERLHLNEHLEYYWRAGESTAWKMAVARGVAILHHKDRPNEEYCSFRRRAFHELANAKHGVRFAVDRTYEWGSNYTDTGSAPETEHRAP
jgi:hypothetical protein